MSPLAKAMAEEQWKLAAVYLLKGLLEAASKLPPEAAVQKQKWLSDGGKNVKKAG